MTIFLRLLLLDSDGKAVQHLSQAGVFDLLGDNPRHANIGLRAKPPTEWDWCSTCILECDLIPRTSTCCCCMMCCRECGDLCLQSHHLFLFCLFFFFFFLLLL
ncbi:MAG: hypothetical protein OSB00_02190, partial [Sphingomonas bacterium]|nr:hypothetical protein [Sphingomonas bacterium]